MSLFKSKNPNFNELWEQNGLGVNVFRLSMNLNRLKFLLRCLRFDDESKTKSRENINSLASICNLFELFIANCRNNYSVGSDVTLYEQLIEYKVNCCPSATNTNKEFPRFGMKIYTLVDTCFNYILNMKIFVKKQVTDSNDEAHNLKNYVSQLMMGYECKLILIGNLTNFSLLKNLLKNDITAVGTLNGCESEIPSEFLSNSSGKQPAIFCGYQNKFVLSSYFDDKNKSIVLLSTLYDPETCNKYDIKSAAECYMSATHAIDRLKSFFFENSFARKTRRFSLRIWFHLLDVASLNSFILYSINNNSNISRRNFLKQLGLSLVDGAIRNRAKNKYIPRQLREDARQFSSSETFCPISKEKIDNKPKRCTVCSKSEDIKVRTFCYSCKMSMCKKHMFSVCHKCFHIKNDEQ